MIFNTLIDIVSQIVLFFISILPNADPNVTNFMNSTGDTLNNMLNGINFMLDIRTFKEVMLLMLTMSIVYIEIRIVMWLIRMGSLGLFKDL